MVVESVERLTVREHQHHEESGWLSIAAQRRLKVFRGRRESVARLWSIYVQSMDGRG